MRGAQINPARAFLMFFLSGFLLGCAIFLSVALIKELSR